MRYEAKGNKGGECENCAKIKTCKKDIGFIWGFCNADFEPKKKEV